MGIIDYLIIAIISIAFIMIVRKSIKSKGCASCGNSCCCSTKSQDENKSCHK